MGRGETTGSVLTPRISLKTWGALGFLALTVLACFSLLPVSDYSFYVTATREWLSGSAQLYENPSSGFFYAPWALTLTVPLSFLPDQLAQAVLNVLSLVGVCGATWVLAKPNSPWEMVPAVANPFTASVFLLGQWDALVLAGIGLGWHGAAQRRPFTLGAGLVLAATKPTNVWLPLLLLLWVCIRWPRRETALTFVLPLVAAAGSFLAAGWDWPLRYVAFVGANPPLAYNVSLWDTPFAPVQAVIAVGGLAWLLWLMRRGIKRYHIGLALAVNPLVSPYLSPYHFVTLAPALVEVFRRRRWMGAGLWVLSLATFLAFVRGNTHPSMLYPIFLVATLALILTREGGEPASAETHGRSRDRTPSQDRPSG